MANLTNNQILGARIRAAEEKFINERKKPCGGGFLVPSSKEVRAHLSELFNLTPIEISYFFTFTRYCSHSWAEGACDQCPDVGP